MNCNLQVKKLQLDFKKNIDNKRAEGEKKYLKSELKFYGIKADIFKAIIKPWYKGLKEITKQDAIKLAKQLWNSEWYEEKAAAIWILEENGKRLTTADIIIVEKMISEVTTWAHLDVLAIKVVGMMIDNDKATLTFLKKWAKDKNFWVKRTAILAQILQFRRSEGNFKLFEQIVVPMFNEGEEWNKQERFFIRKAIGWALRELSRKDPETVFKFAKKYKEQMSGLSYREATRRLPPQLLNKL